MRIVIAIAIIGTVVLCPEVRAENLSATNCPDETLAYYQVNFSSATPGSVSGPCANGILNFSGFGFDSSGNPVNALKGNGDIEITPVGPERGGLGDTGFSISAVSGIFSAGAGQTATYVIDWHFDIDNGPSTNGASLGLDPPFGDVTITQDYCVDSFITAYRAGTDPTCYTGTNAGGPPIQSLQVTTDLPFASIVFDPVAYSFGDVRTIIQLNGGLLGAGFDSLTGTATVVPTPENSTTLLVIGGLMMACFTRNRAIRQQS